MKKRPIAYICLPLLSITLIAAGSLNSTAKTTSRKRITYPKTAPAPPKLEDLPRFPIDTVDTADPDTKIITFTNNTWEYYRPSLHMLDDMPAYREHWDTTQVFAYRNFEAGDLPSIVKLQLVTAPGQYHYPIKGSIISRYGPRGKRSHLGVDIPLHTGEPIYATFDGRVRYAKYNTGGFGNLVIVRHQNGLETWNAHLSKLNVKPNDYVKAGQVIGFGGSTGRSTGPHLHFETRYYDQNFDPERLIDFPSGTLKSPTFALEKSFFNIHSHASDQLDEGADSTDTGVLLADVAAGSDDATAQSGTIVSRIVKAQEKPATVLVKQAKPVATAVYHTVQQGNTLGGIAGKYGVSIDQICRLNGITRTTVLKLGRKLRVK